MINFENPGSLFWRQLQKYNDLVTSMLAEKSQNNINTYSPKKQKTKTIQVYKKENKHSEILVIILIIFIVFVGYYFIKDFKQEKDYEQMYHQIKISECIQQYKDANCDDPIPQLINRCKSLKNCHVQETPQTALIFRIINNIIQNIFGQLGWLGSIFLVFSTILLIFVCLKQCTREVVIRTKYN